jgi:hypothetical protein
MVQPVLILIIRLFVSVGKVLQLIRKAEKQKLQNIVLAVVKEMIQPFTFLNHVVLSEKDLVENKKIIVAHEQAHIKQLHAIDLAVCEVFTLLHFFNPLMWLLRRDLKLNHEFLADQAVLNKGIDAQKYQLLALQKAVGESRFALANHFTQKPILKRTNLFNFFSRQKSSFIGDVPVLKHHPVFFPYKYLTDKNWDEVLREYIPVFINAKTALEYQLAVLQLAGETNDTYARLFMEENKTGFLRGERYAAFRVRFIENKLTVIDYFKPFVIDGEFLPPPSQQNQPHNKNEVIIVE